MGSTFWRNRRTALNVVMEIGGKSETVTVNAGDTAQQSTPKPEA